MHRYSNLWFCDQLIVEIAAQQFGDEEKTGILTKTKSWQPWENNNIETSNPGKIKQAMITLWRMAEHKFSNIYNYQCLTLVLYLYGKKRQLANIRPSLQFYGMIILVKTKLFCRGMA